MNKKVNIIVATIIVFSSIIVYLFVLRVNKETILETKDNPITENNEGSEETNQKDKRSDNYSGDVISQFKNAKTGLEAKDILTECAMVVTPLKENPSINEEAEGVAESMGLNLSGCINLVALYESDSEGGETPEETIKLYLTALEKKDIEGAARYYQLYDQKEKIADLKFLLDNNKYEDWIKTVKSAKKTEDDEDFASFEYSFETLAEERMEGTNIVMPAGVYKSSINLQKIPSGVWKIEY